MEDTGLEIVLHRVFPGFRVTRQGKEKTFFRRLGFHHGIGISSRHRNLGFYQNQVPSCQIEVQSHELVADAGRISRFCLVEEGTIRPKLRKTIFDIFIVHLQIILFVEQAHHESRITAPPAQTGS